MEMITKKFNLDCHDCKTQGHWVNEYMYPPCWKQTHI